jgi:hypothetical protein
MVGAVSARGSLALRSDDGDADWFRQEALVHMLVLSLEHLHKCLNRGSGQRDPDFPWDLAQRFNRAWEPLSDIRDTLEHEDEYIGRTGKDQESRVSERLIMSFSIRGTLVPVLSSLSPQFDDDGAITGVSILGVYHDLSEVLDLARQLELALAAYIKA